MVAHTCRCLHVATQDAQLQAHLATLPVTVDLVSDGLRVLGLTPALVADIITDDGWANAQLSPVTLGECHCKLKTAVVPAGGADMWADAMRNAPFGPSELQDAWQYLGATVSAPSAHHARHRQGPQLPITLEWTGPQIYAAVHGSWRRAMTCLAARAAAIAGVQCSQARRAAMWNT